MEINKYKKLLEEEKAQLEIQLSDLGIFDPETGDWGAKLDTPNTADLTDKNDKADRDEDFAVSANTLGPLEERWNDVKDALAKLDANDGSYGKCEVSGEMIEEDRLEANPAARTNKANMN